MTETKRCSRGELCAHPNGPVLPLSEFHKSKHKPDGYHIYCKVCRSIEAHDRHVRTYISSAKYPKAPPGMRFCRGCMTMKPLDAFQKRCEKYNPGRCKECIGRWKKEYYRKSTEYREHLLAQQRERYRDPAIREQKRSKQRQYELQPEVREQINQRRRLRVKLGLVAQPTPERRTRMRAAARNREARERNAPGKHTAEDILCLREQQRDKCFYCGIDCSDDPTVDHVVPLKQCGSNGPENLVIACRSCNSSKNDRTPEQWGWYASCPVHPGEA